MCMIRSKQFVCENGELKMKLMPIRFNGDVIKEFINSAFENGWEPEPLVEGTLGYGVFVMWAPQDGGNNFIVREVYENEWSSRYTVEQFRKPSKRLEKELEQLRAQYC